MMTMLSLQRVRGPALAVATVVAAIALDVLLSACGGYLEQTPTGPTEIQRFTVTITASGVSPAIVQVPVCRGVCDVILQFVNADSVTHDVRSDPHPAHTECTAYEAIGAIAPGQTKEARVSACGLPERSGYHDETRPADQAFWGRVAK
jgi:hypothetical protein